MTALLELRTTVQERLRLADSERGAALLEYALLVSLIAIVCLLAIVFLGEEASSTLTDSGNSISSAN